MELILAAKTGEEVRLIPYPKMDCDLNGQRTFQLDFSTGDWQGIDHGMRVFVNGEEYGGVVGELMTDTSTGTISVSGKTWRGMLADKVLVPGGDYYTVSGELNAVIRSLVDGQFSGIIKGSSANTGVTVSYRFKRFCTLLDGLTDMLRSVGFRLHLAYDEVAAHMVVSAVRAVDYSPQVELSQDYQLNFKLDDKRDGVNHLVCGGSGELSQREVVHLYVDGRGNIGTTQHYYGVDEVMAFFDDSSASGDDLVKAGTDRLKELKSKKTFEMEIESIPDAARIGDIVGGRDYITGMSMTEPIGNIVVQINGDVISKQYTLEEE